MSKRDEIPELILKMYKYASAIDALINSGELTREGLGHGCAYI